MVVRWTIISILAAALSSAPLAARQPDAEPQPISTVPQRDDSTLPSRARAAHIRLRGDLDSMACVDDLRARLDQAREDRTTLLVLEIDANRTRPDVLLALAAAIRDSEVPTIGFLIDDRDRRVTAPALALALAVGDRVAIDPATAISFERGDWSADLLPDDLVAADAIEEFRMAVQRSLAGREIDPTISSAWLPDADSGAGEPLDARALAALGIEAILAPSVAQVCRAVGHRGQTPRPELIESALHSSREQVHALLRQADVALEDTRRGLDLQRQRPDRREVSVHDHRRAGEEGLDRLARAAAAVDHAEELLREYPEILLAAPPGRTDVGTSRYSLRSAWRYRLDDLRDDIEYWRERAKDSASR